jgi:hypothetical protein
MDEGKRILGFSHRHSKCPAFVAYRGNQEPLPGRTFPDAEVADGLLVVIVLEHPCPGDRNTCQRLQWRTTVTETVIVMADSRWKELQLSID